MTKSVSKYTFFLGFKSYWIFLTGNTCVFFAAQQVLVRKKEISDITIYILTF